MNVYKRYFTITTGPLIKRIQEIRKVNDKANISYRKILKEIGAKEECYILNNRITGIIFEGTPDKKLYKKLKYGWWPKKSTKAGKELNKRFADIKTINEDSALEIVGLSSSPQLFTAGKCYYSTVIIVPTEPMTVITQTPWYDEDPEKIAAYVEGEGDANMSSLLWKPTSDMVEVKEWEYKKVISDYNESIKE